MRRERHKDSLSRMLLCLLGPQSKSEDMMMMLEGLALGLGADVWLLVVDSRRAKESESG